MAVRLDRLTKDELVELVLRLRDRLELAGIGEVRGPIEVATEVRVDALELREDLRPHGAVAIRLAALLDSGAELRSMAAQSKEWRAVMDVMEAESRAAEGDPDADDDDGDPAADELRRLREAKAGQQTG